jgi:sugar/nucleoside kinase (ribokinase family)
MTSAGTVGTTWDVIGLGANSVDYVYMLPGYPQASGARAKMRVSAHFLTCGGQMVTALATCSRMGLRTKYIGITGTDDNGRRVREELGRWTIDLTDAIIRDVPNQFAVILVEEQSGERIVLWDRPDGLRLRERDVPAEVLLSTRVLHVDDVDQDAAIRAARLARDRGILVTSDIDRVNDLTEELVASVTFPMFAEHVPSALTGEDDPERALRKLRRRHDGLLCVTLGANGAMALDGDRVLYAPAFKVEAVDTTGAGDVFRGAFICALLEGRPPDDVLRFANAAAAVSCTRVGAINGVPSLEETIRVMTAESHLPPFRSSSEDPPGATDESSAV